MIYLHTNAHNPKATPQMKKRRSTIAFKKINSLREQGNDSSAFSTVLVQSFIPKTIWKFLLFFPFLYLLHLFKKNKKKKKTPFIPLLLYIDYVCWIWLGILCFLVLLFFNKQHECFPSITSQAKNHHFLSIIPPLGLFLSCFEILYNIKYLLQQQPEKKKCKICYIKYFNYRYHRFVT